jgi:hypothetical protein
MKVQECLRAKTQKGMEPVQAVASLADELAIRSTFHPLDPLVILNYDQIHSPKKNDIVRDCRGLTLELGSWDVVARSFRRFFNAGEDREGDDRFDWQNFNADAKEDGSLALLYRYQGSWRVNTRGSFALGEIGPGVGMTWEETFYQGLDEMGMDDLPEGYTFVFELCSPYNRVVRRYDQVTLFLLTAFHNATGTEPSEALLDRWAQLLQVERPRRFSFVSLDDIRCYLEEVEKDPTFEGVVVRDRYGERLKVKSSRYVALHHLHDNGNLFLTKRLLPLILQNEVAEVALCFPEVVEKSFDVVEKLYGPYGRMLAVWEIARGLPTQKEFALFVTKHTKLAAVLFEARKQGREPADVFRQSESYLLKTVFNQ